MIWQVVFCGTDPVYVTRCSRCGRYPEKLLKHFFFTGLYCFRCVHDELYRNVWNFQEINAAKESYDRYDPREKLKLC